MKTQTFLLPCFLLFGLAFNAQTWTWMHGTDSLQKTARYGVKGTSSSTNRPAAVTDAYTWTDLNGNLWLYGGSNPGISSIGYSDDLWKFNPALNEWTWIRGTGVADAIAVFGTLTVSSSSNTPGGRADGGYWVDAAGDLWLFGGYGFDVNGNHSTLSDLWRYNIANNEWTWMAGPNIIAQPGVYGTMGVSSPTVRPGARSAPACWTTSNYLWMYGGTGYAASTWGYLGDMWKFNLTTSEWTWVKGSASSYPAAVHNTQGIASTNGTPGSRSAATFWKDNNNNFWLFSGNGNQSGFGSCTWGDLWKFDNSTNNWTWMKGSNNPYTSPVYGPLGVATSTADPGMHLGAAGWVDQSNDLWIFGGQGFYQSSLGRYNDLWKYSIATNQWTWMKGPTGLNASGIYGQRLIPAAGNNPGARNISMAWQDNNNGFWLYGGLSTVINSNHHDLWRLTFCTTSVQPVTNVTSNTTQVCQGSVLGFSATSSSSLVVWYSNASPTTALGTGISFSTSALSANIYTVYAVTANSCTASSPVGINVTVSPVSSFAVSSGTICAGTIFTLSPSMPGNFVYSSGTSTVAPGVTTSYTVTGISSSGCAFTNTAISTVTVFNLPTVTVNSGSICPGQPFVISPSGAQNYSVTGNVFVINPLVSGTYIVTGEDTLGCKATATSSVVVAPPPLITAQGGSICAGNVFTIMPAGGVTYTYSNGSQTVAPQTTTSYSVSGHDGNGCESQQPASLTVIVHNLPTPYISASTSDLCQGDQVILSASGAVNYTWSTGVTTPLSVIYPFTSTVIVLTGASAEGCQATTSLVINVSVCTDVADFQEQSFTVYPNPYHDKLVLETRVAGSVDIINSKGMLVFRQTCEAGITELQPELNSGIYFLRYSHSKGMLTRKIIKD